MFIINKFLALSCGLARGLDRYLYPFLDLFMRYWMARIFFRSGLAKIGSWSSTLDLFRYEFKIPILPYELAAQLATTTELISPVLLVLGLATRMAAAPMLVMAFVIQFTYLDLPQHYFWMMILGTLILRGPSSISLDYWIAKRFCK